MVRFHFTSVTSACCLALTLLLSESPLAHGQFLPRGRDAAEVKAAFREVVARPSESTVRIFCNDKAAALGTIVTVDGCIVTKASLLQGRVVCQLKDGRSLPAKIVGIEDRHDLAMVKVNTVGLVPVSWEPSKSAEPGNWLATPGPGKDPLAIGVVSVATRKTGQRDFAGRAPGANSGFLGVLLEDASTGPVIAEVTPGSAAEKAGIKAGDIVLAVAGRLVDSRERLILTIQGYKAGDVVRIKVKRGEKEEEISAKLGRRPAGESADRSERMNRMGSELSDRRIGFPTILQHDMVVKPNDCGGPIVNLDGKAVGINIARAGRVESYAIPSEIVLSLIPELRSGKLAPAEDKEDAQIADLQKKLDKLRVNLATAENRLKNLISSTAKGEDEVASLEVEKQQTQKKIVDLRKQVAELQGEIKLLQKDRTK